jgi:hypothetical protein
MEKLVCDKCGFELTDIEAIDMAFGGTKAWQDAQRRRGFEPRGVFPCKYYIRCQGEMILVKESKTRKSTFKQDN